MALCYFCRKPISMADKAIVYKAAGRGLHPAHAVCGEPEIDKERHRAHLSTLPAQIGDVEPRVVTVEPRAMNEFQRDRQRFQPFWGDRADTMQHGKVPDLRNPEGCDPNTCGLKQDKPDLGVVLKSEKCPNALLPDGPVCPRCGERRGASGAEGGSWVHY